MTHYRNAGRACAQPRSRALERDPAAVAAAHFTGRPHVTTIDLTRLLCDKKSCFPVIGGALVYKDIHHVMDAQQDLVEVLARFDPKLVKMSPDGERPED